MSRFPVAFRPPAFRFSVIRYPPRSWALLTVGLPGTPPACPDLDGVTAFRTHELRPGWVPSIPRGRRCYSTADDRARPAPAALPRLVLQPRSSIPSCGAPLYEASTRIHAIHPSGHSLACGRPDGTGRRLGFPPRLPNPADQEPTTHVRGGDRPSSTDLKQRLRHQPNLQSCVVTRFVRPRVAPIKGEVLAVVRPPGRGAVFRGCGSRGAVGHATVSSMPASIRQAGALGLAEAPANPVWLADRRGARAHPQARP
jgi:hypothetical protein